MQFSMNGKVTATIADMLDLPTGRVKVIDESNPRLNGGFRPGELPVITSMRVGNDGRVTGEWGSRKIQNASLYGSTLRMGNVSGKSMASWYFTEQPMAKIFTDLAVAIHWTRYLQVGGSWLRRTPLIFLRELVDMPDSYVMHYPRNLGKSVSINWILEILQRRMVQVPMWSTLFERSEFSSDYLPESYRKARSRFSWMSDVHFGSLDSSLYPEYGRYALFDSITQYDYPSIFPERALPVTSECLRRKIFGATIPAKHSKKKPIEPRVLFPSQTPAQITAWVNR
ncbi:hypothetical protein D3C86_821930 [compost metagenome]